MSPETILVPLMFVTLIVFLLLGIPVAFALSGTALLFSLLGIKFGLFSFDLLYALPERLMGIAENYILLAIPFFIFMGSILERSGLAEDLLETMGQAFGSLRGGLAISVVVVGTLLAAATGIVGATVITMGLISLPAMLRHGYSKKLACGVIAASGTLGQIIPPSIVLIVLADQLGVSVGDMFLAAIIPGLILSGFYVLYVFLVSLFKPEIAPAIPKEKNVSTVAFIKKVLKVVFPPLFLIAVVLGSIFAGWATPTEAGAFGAVGAMVLAWFSGRLTRKTLEECLTSTVKLSSMVLFILVGATFFTLVFRGLYGDFVIEDLLTHLPGKEYGFLLTVNLVVFILGFFLDFFEIVFIVVPLVAPVAERLLSPIFSDFSEPSRIALVWFGIIISMNLQTSFLTPPLGFSLFYLKGVSPPEVTTADIYKGVVPFILIQIIALASIIFFPEISVGILK
ncbi:TRAP dicarboxylate transporter, DctM subunit [Thermodesulfatator indicus DSM 15286]|uniref:TRAP dicarboxylate transporter, DctM subunit n=1 Tax=Thermodesulfatator indicus (strain DSM 15286 / JCM 11887 / CIR29812) TaxID=667014 RepID=F8AD07_THEID|nr:TRAP transporter large permease subunit [Thermodesulfatator indicus]AEH45873.1 TRAP dicarboxylate transporter, DctM subunit [Thermodesulfatator indicus DSM 15286]